MLTISWTHSITAINQFSSQRNQSRTKNPNSQMFWWKGGSIYRKSTWNGQYTSFQSWIPLEQKGNLIHSLCTEVRWICIEDTTDIKLDKLRQTLINYGYPPRFPEKNLKLKQQHECPQNQRRLSRWTFRLKEVLQKFWNTNFQELWRKPFIHLKFALSFLVSL